MRIGFVTCVQLGLSCIEAILVDGGHLDLLVTLTDDRAVKKSGRVFLDDVASMYQIPLHKVNNINEPDALQVIASAELDWLFIIGWSQIASPAILGSARNGAIGMHPTLLPVGRGRASIPWAILLGLKETGVTLFQMDEGVDTGPILAQTAIPICDDETAATLYGKIDAAHVELIRRIWPALVTDQLTPRRQDEAKATNWVCRRPEDGEIHPDQMTVDEVDRLVRAVTHPYPGAFLRCADDSVLRVWSGTGGPDLARVGVEIALADGMYTALDSVVESFWSPSWQGSRA